MKIKLMLLYLPLIFFFAIPAFAQERVVDNAGLLSAGDKQNLINLLASITSEYNFDLVIVTEKNIGNKSPADFADDFFDYNGYGFGQNNDGCILLHVTDSRDIYAGTSGRGIEILTETAQNKLLNDAVKFLSAGNNYEAYRSFLNNWEEFLVLEEHGRSYNFIHQWNIVFIIIAWALAIIIGLIIVSSWKSKMNTAITASQAVAYIVPDSVVFKTKNDNFLYSTVTKTKRQQQTSSSGGSKTRISSSGSRHGGGGRKY